jgi:hypothetical protein
MVTLGEADVRAAALKVINENSIDVLIDRLQRAQIGDS